MSFLQVFEKFGIDVGRGALLVFNTAGPSIANVAGTSLGGPLVGSLAAALISSVIQAEKNHIANSSPTPTVINPANGSTVDPRKFAVLEDFKSFAPLIELAVAALGSPIADKVAFEAALSDSIDATVASLNAYARVLQAIHGVVVA